MSEDQHFSQDEADAIVRRASEIEAARRLEGLVDLSREELALAAREAGLSEAAILQAIAEQGEAAPSEDLVVLEGERDLDEVASVLVSEYGCLPGALRKIGRSVFARFDLMAEMVSVTVTATGGKTQVCVRGERLTPWVGAAMTGTALTVLLAIAFAVDAVIALGLALLSGAAVFAGLALIGRRRGLLFRDRIVAAIKRLPVSRSE